MHQVGIVMFYLLVVFFLLFFALGQKSFAGSEDRWAEIARNMLLHHDWFHPVINGEVYFDKPLLSYWFITIAAFFTQTLNEFTVRLPGALTGLLTLFCSYKIAVEWFDRRIGWLSVGLIIASYGFLFWTHTASAELSNLAFITAAVAWFVRRRDQTDFVSYLVFYLICAAGSQLKGLTASVVPILVITPYILREKRWKAHLNIAHLGALIVAVGLFLLPYLGATVSALPTGVEAQHNQLSGLDLLIRENIVRFFHPFDHVDPFYSYLYQVPRIVFPWTFLLLAALVNVIPQYRKLGQSHRWLLEAVGLVFLFFTLSGSRRWYYILPIMPFCMMLIAAYMAEARESKWRRPAALATLFTLGSSAVLLILFPVIARIVMKHEALPMTFWIGSATTLLGAGLIALLGKYRKSVLSRITGVDTELSHYFMPTLLLLSVLVLGVVFDFVLPGADSYRQVKPFALSLAQQMKPEDKLAVYKRPNSTLDFYLNSPNAIPVINTRSDIAPSAGGWVIVTEKKDTESLFTELPELKTAEPILQVKQISGKLFSEKTNLMAYRLF